MKKILFFAVVLVIIVGLAGCTSGTRKEESAPADSMKAITDDGDSIDPYPADSMDAEAGNQSAPTLDEGIVGTWNLYAGYGQSGELVYVTPDSTEYAFIFDADNGFTGYYQLDNLYVNSYFIGTYDFTDSQAVDENPYNWKYYATINKDSIVDVGESSLLGQQGEQGLHLIFSFRELDGEKLLYEEMQGYYFKK